MKLTDGLAPRVNRKFLMARSSRRCCSVALGSEAEEKQGSGECQVTSFIAVAIPVGRHTVADGPLGSS